jgi:HK97 family phage major capsid protein
LAVYNAQVTRADAPQGPEQVITNAILQGLPEASMVLGAGPRRVTMARAQARMPVLSVLPEAYFVNGDTGLKETTRAAWQNKFLNVEELAVIVPIPDAVVEDTDLDILAAVQPLIIEALGAKVDAAVLFGVGKPASWDLGHLDPTKGLAQVCDAYGNTVTAGTNQDPSNNPSVYLDLVATMRKVAEDGHPVTAFMADALYEYDLLGVVDTLGRPIFTPSPQVGGVAGLLARPFNYLNNGAWDEDYNVIAGDMRNLIVGIRRDVTWEVFREGVITDDSGKVLFNLMQQDSRALRMTMRLAVTVGNPLKRRSQNMANPYPFAVLKAA